jgi:hypothetical protein
VLLSFLVVLWAHTRPGYDPYGWLVWGKLTIHLKLDTNGAPSWKPLPFLFTVPYALFGHYQLWLWMVTSVAVSLGGIVFAWRVAFNLVEAEPQRRYAAYAAGLSAAAFLLGTRDYTHFILSSQSDTMIVSLCLAAIDCHICGRHRWAFWMWLLAAMGRPEVWPFLGLSALWLWFTKPSYRRWVAIGVVLLPVFWFGIPGLTSKSVFTAGNIANNSPRELKNNKFFGTIDRFFDLHEVPVQVAALIAVLIAAYSLRRVWPRGSATASDGAVRDTDGWRDRVTRAWTALLARRGDAWMLALAAGAVLWVLIEAAFALHGWPAVSRYLFEPVAAMCVLAGVFVGRVILDVPPYLAGIVRRLSPRLPRPRLAERVGAWGAVLVVGVLAGSMLPSAAFRLRIERSDRRHEVARTREIGRLAVVIQRLGAGRILACGQPNIPIGYQSQFAWYANVKIGELYVSQTYERLHPHPLVNIFPLSNGWKVFPSHVTAASSARCSGLRLTYRA